MTNEYTKSWLEGIDKGRFLERRRINNFLDYCLCDNCQKKYKEFRESQNSIGNNNKKSNIYKRNVLPRKRRTVTKGG